jgi:hypothetical protein
VALIRQEYVLVLCEAGIANADMSW